MLKPKSLTFPSECCIPIPEIKAYMTYQQVYGHKSKKEQE